MILRFICRKHDVDLESLNNESPLYRLDSSDKLDAADFYMGLANGIIDTHGRVLRPGIWYVPDFSDFTCPLQETPVDEEEDEAVGCMHTWTVSYVG